jgi:hypothetical protein
MCVVDSDDQGEPVHDEQHNSLFLFFFLLAGIIASCGAFHWSSNIEDAVYVHEVKSPLVF